MSSASRAMINAFERRLERDLGRPVRIAACRKPGQGLSNETFLLSLASNGKLPPPDIVVARCVPESGLFESYDLSRQYRLLEALADTAVPVPRLLGWHGPAPGDAVPDAMYFMQFIQADIPPEGWFERGILYEADPAERQRIGEALIGTLGTIHDVDWRAHKMEWLAPNGAADQDLIKSDLDLWEMRLELGAGRNDPRLCDALAWLTANQPISSEIVLLHGDCKPSNYGFLNGQCVAVFDWELARLGDPAEDVAWFLAHAWRDGPPLPGFPDRAEFCDIYSRKTGRSIRNLLYYEALSLFKFIVIGHLAMRHQADAEQEALDTAFQAFHHGLSTVIASAEKEETA